MALIRLEPKRDRTTDLYYLEIYHPHDALQPFVTTEPRYMSAAAAENDVIAIIASRTNKPSSGRVAGDGQPRAHTLDDGVHAASISSGSE
jgi:hypothetical protein